MSCKLLAQCVLAITCALAGIARAQDVVAPSDRVTSFVRIRSAPDGDSSSVPLWHEIQLPDGTTGFVSKAWTTTSFPLGPRAVDELRIHFLNVGPGTCTVVECPGASAPPMIVDCGTLGGTPVDLDATQIRDYVRKILSQHTVAPNVVLSHGDLDHYGQIPNALDGISVASVWQGGNPDDYVMNAFPTWIADQASRGAVLHREFPPDWHNDGDPVSADLSCGDASTFVLTVNTGTTKNARSLVLMVEYQDFTAILTGDAEGETETQAINNFPDLLKATVMASSHHGAGTHGSNGHTWATTTAPELLISSAGDRFFHPQCASTNRFTSLVETKEHEVRCGESGSYTTSRTERAHYVTEVSGAIIVTTNGRSPLALHCTRSADCGVRIPH